MSRHNSVKIGTAGVDGILRGECYIFPYLEGVTCSIVNDNDSIITKANGKVCTLMNDSHGFAAYVLKTSSFLKFFKNNPTIKLYGEFLPRTSKKYSMESCNHLYITDVFYKGKFMPYSEYQPILERAGIKYVPATANSSNLKVKDLYSYVDSSHYLINEGMNGITVKRYDFVNHDNKTLWGYILPDDEEYILTKMIHSSLEYQIINTFLTEDFVEATSEKIGGKNWNKSMFAIFATRVYNEMLSQKIVEILKKFENPVIDFEKLKTMAINHIEDIKD